MTIIKSENYLMHYGILRKSGRYPWGSGGNPNQRARSFIGHLHKLREEGMTEAEIAKGFGMTTTELRAANSMAKTQKKQDDILQAQKLKDKGWSNVEIGKRMEINESSVRSLLAPGAKDKADILKVTSDMLRDEVDQHGYLDVGIGVEHHLGISKEKLGTAVAVLKGEGYTVNKVQIDQLGTTNKTTIKVLGPKGKTYKDVVTNLDKINSINKVSDDGGRSWYGIYPPLSVNSKRVGVRYAEDGGAEFDGVIYVRPGKDDLSLGGARYAQVRVAVDGSHYLKGMAMYKDDLPAGVDLQFNTNKSDTGNKLDAMKPLSNDPDNPFGASISRQITKDLPDGGKKVTSVMNLVNEEGRWETWKRSLSPQVLSKQSPALAKTQLDMTYESKKAELDEIMSLTNPVVRRKLLETYADSADSSAVHLKAAALPRQRSQVILPVNTLKDGEVYAPNFRNGERVALIRYPHGGKFEIPELTVNNRHPDARRLIGPDAADAIGINSKVAERLSGADFDGDTVLVIPNPSSKPLLSTEPALAGLKGFDPQRSYPPTEGMVFKGNKQQLMGDVSNLITDMTIKGANHTELAAAVRHSMVVIDAEKKNLDYKRSARENGISNLKRKYQGSAQAGASTLVSSAKGRIYVPKRRPRPAAKGGPVDRATGKKVFEETGESYVSSKTGKLVIKTDRSTKLAETDDAFSLSSGTKIEKVYAEHSNRLKSLANAARKAAVNTETKPYSPSAKKAYASAVKSLDAKLNLALRNSPVERHAQLLANATVAMKRAANPDMDFDELKKIKSQALNEARLRTGADKKVIDISDDEWSAIQAGAVSPNKLGKILNNADLDRVKQLATPRTPILMSGAKLTRAKAMASSGYTQAEIADALGIGLTTLKEGLKNG